MVYETLVKDESVNKDTKVDDKVGDVVDNDNYFNVDGVVIDDG